MAPTSFPLALDTDKPSRYELVRLLGEGGTGQVYLATDRESGEQLALKRLLRMDSRTVLRLKREFRSLADLDHPNLVKLYDLVHERDGLALVMEYIDGIDLAQQLARIERTERHGPQVWGMFHQLARGVRALHAARLLHRDLKPSNVVVTDERVVLLDFGLVRGLDKELVAVTLEDTAPGTPAYMAPEQAVGEELTEASDWYAVGVMLYEAVSGVRPIDAHDVGELLRRKRTCDPAPLPPSPAVPDTLRALCMAMLQRDPRRRPRGDEIVARLAALADPSPDTQTQPHERPAPVERLTLVGRDMELAQLRAAMERATVGSVAVHLRGGSGAGKSALLERFLSEIEHGSDTALVLRSRCYEREAMPFKALDGIVDALVRHLSSLEDLEVAHLMPRELAELTQLFPMFERSNPIHRLLTGKKPRGDARQVRQRAELGLRELIMRLGGRWLPVVVIDDLHWGDLDSARVLRDWLHEPISPLLLIFSYRDAEVDTSPCLRAILDSPRPLPPSATNEVWLDLGPLSDRDVQELCRTRADARRTMPPALISRIVHEAQGNPFLAQQLTALVQAHVGANDLAPSSLSLGELVTHADALLPIPARALLDVLSVAGRPLSPRLALAAAGIAHDGRGHIHRLQRLHLLRMRDVAGERLIEVYHDRVREIVNAACSAERRTQIHLALLREAEREAGDDSHWLHVLALGAGDHVAALRYGRLAAERATASLAFERAAELYTVCLTLCDAKSDRAYLWERLALSLARSGQGVKAAEAYLRATEHMAQERAVPLWQLAASHFLRSGRFDEGDALVDKVFATLKLDVPATEAGKIAAIGWELARLALRGEAFELRDDPDAREALKRFELYVALAIECISFAPLRATLFQARALRCAYESGEPAALARALSVAATVACISGTPRAAGRAKAMLDRAAQLARHSGGSNLRCELELHVARAICSMWLGRLSDVIDASTEAARIYESQSGLGEHGEYYHMFSVHAARLGALQNLGHYQTAALELAYVLELVKASDNRTALLLLTVPVTMAEQVADQCARSRERLREERKQLPTGEFAIIHLQHLIATMRAACITGDFAWALPIVEHDWPLYLKSHLYRGAYMAYVAHTTHARLLLNRYAVERRGDPERLVRDDLRGLTRLPQSAFTAGSLCRHRARIALFRGDHEQAKQLLRQSVAALNSIGFRDESERDRYALGAIIGGAEGSLLMAESLASLRELGCSEPLIELRGYFPELMGDCRTESA